MGIRYYAWPLRDEYDVVHAHENPLKYSSLIDKREAMLESELYADPNAGCLYLDKAWGPLQHLFDDASGSLPGLQCSMTPTPRPRPGLLMLRGQVIFRHDEYAPWDPFYGVVSPAEVRRAAEDYGAVDPDGIAAYGESRRTDDGRYLRQYFTALRDYAQRWARAGFGCLYRIGWSRKRIRSSAGTWIDLPK